MIPHRKLGRLLYIFLKNRKKDLKISYSAHINFATKLEGFNVIHKGAVLSGSTVGYASYIGENSYLPNVEIGRYCSIANNVEVLPYTHPTSKFVSTHPAFYSKLKQSGFTYSNEQLYNENITVKGKESITALVGHDVWIGARVLIMGGVTIGNGAIIAAGSVVTKPVPPYAIVGGIPAKIIRMRFNEPEIKDLEKINWWDSSPEWIKDNLEKFSDIQEFLITTKKS